MLSAIATKAGELLAVAVVTGVALLVATTAGVWWLLRALRRRVLGVAAGWAVAGAAGAAGAGRRWLWSRPLPNRRWIAARLARRRLWRTVSGAQHAVTAARAAGAPTGELNVLCQRLARAAQDADRSLAIASRAQAGSGGPEPVSSQVGSLVQAGRQIQDAAAAAVAAMAQPAVTSLADDVHREVAALSAGLASATRGPGAGGLPGGTP